MDNETKDAHQPEKNQDKIFNFTHNYQFTTRLGLNQENIEVMTETKLLGTVIQNNIRWDSTLSKGQTQECYYCANYQNLVHLKMI